VENEKSFLQRLYEALEAETHDNTEATSPTRGLDGSGHFSLAPSNPPPGGEAENSVQDGFTHIDPPRGCFPQKTYRATFVGDPPVHLIFRMG
jgi:hypothetical protein